VKIRRPRTKKNKRPSNDKMEKEGRNASQIYDHVKVTPQGCINPSLSRLESSFCCRSQNGQLKWDMPKCGPKYMGNMVFAQGIIQNMLDLSPTARNRWTTRYATRIEKEKKGERLVNFVAYRTLAQPCSLERAISNIDCDCHEDASSA